MIATLTTTRGDRGKIFDFVEVQIDKQTRQPDKRILINTPPDNGDVDLVKRVRQGLSLAKSSGIQRVYIWEDDDSYPSSYIEEMEKYFIEADFVGYDDTTYYNIKNRTWMNQTHPKRSSLFCTAFRLEALEGFVWPADHYPWLDIRLWEFARDQRKKVKLLKGNPCTGIKHGIGLCAGKSHSRMLEHSDRDLSFLKSRVEDYQYQFYSTLKL
jgi:hypothetical protein